MMRKLRVVSILLIFILAASVAGGCTLVDGKEEVYFYEKPAIGFTVADDVITDVDLEKQDSLRLSTKDGIIKIIPYSGNKLQVIEKRKLTGPAFKKTLKALLMKNKLQIIKDTNSVELKNEPDIQLKPFYRITDDIELKVPESIKVLDVDASSGGIGVSSLNGFRTIDLTINKGNIKVDKSKAYLLDASITDGNLYVSEFEGTGTYKCGRGNIKLNGTKGEIKAKSLSGNILIEKAEGMLDCDISTGSLTVRSSGISEDSVLYASNGDIDADLSNVNSSGRYTIRASKGQIKLKLSETSGWSLLAKSTKGRIINHMATPADELEKAPSGELYGDVRGGGATIDAYIDMGNIMIY